MFGQPRTAPAVQPVTVPNPLVLWERNQTRPWKHWYLGTTALQKSQCIFSTTTEVEFYDNKSEIYICKCKLNLKYEKWSLECHNNGKVTKPYLHRHFAEMVTGATQNCCRHWQFPSISVGGTLHQYCRNTLKSNYENDRSSQAFINLNTMDINLQWKIFFQDSSGDLLFASPLLIRT